MKIELLAFGKIAEVVGDKQQLEGITDTASLQDLLQEKYPQLTGLPFRIAVNKVIVSGNTMLQDDAVVALMPPFSGG